jgi:hypothetical protein
MAWPTGQQNGLCKATTMATMTNVHVKTSGSSMNICFATIVALHLPF